MFLLPEKESCNEEKTNSFFSERRVIGIGTSICFILFGGILLLMTHVDHTGSAQLGDFIDTEEQISSSTDAIITQPEQYHHVSIPTLIGELPDPATFDAEGMVVKDVNSGTILFEKWEKESHPMASITKLMTALVLLDLGVPWGDTVSVSPDATGDSHMYAGDTYTVEDLWVSMLVASSNKAAMTLVDHIAPSREVFVSLMNAKATELGLEHTVFVEPTGLEEGNLSTPQEVSILLDHALAETPIREAVKTQEKIIYAPERDELHHMWNTNWLLIGWIPNSFYYIVGGKTGHIDASKYNFAGRVVTDDGRILDAVIFGASTHEARFTEFRDIVEAVHTAYEWK